MSHHAKTARRSTELKATQRASFALAPLTSDPYLLRTEPSKAPARASSGPTPVPLRLIKRPELFSECGHGTCPITPGCTGRCYLRQAHQALRKSISQGEADLPDAEIDHAARRRAAIGLLAYMSPYLIAFAILGVWWLFS